MRKEAELHAEEDRQSRESVEARNEADNAVYRSEKMLKDNADKIGGHGRRAGSRARSRRSEKALKGSDAAAIKAASEKLNEAWQAVSAELYKAAADKARAGKAESGATGGTPGRRLPSRTRAPSSMPRWWTRRNHDFTRVAPATIGRRLTDADFSRGECGGI